MSNLSVQVSNFKRQLNRIRDDQKHEIVIGSTNIIARELNKLSSALSSQLQFLNAISFINRRYENSPSHSEIFNNDRDYNAHVGMLSFKEDFSSKLELAISKFETFRKDWEVLEYKVQQQESYTDARDTLSSLISTLSDNNSEHWNKWLAIIDAEIKIEEEFLEKQKYNPSQKVNYDEFHSKSSFFKNKLKEREKNQELAQDIQRLASKLADIKANFDLSDFPKDVERFFKSVDSRYETATLEHLSPEVMKWITEHNYLKNFKIERK
jgi:hypothetical protein